MLQAQLIQSNDEQRLSSARTNADRIEAEFAEIVLLLETLRDALIDLKVKAETAVTPPQRWSLEIPPTDAEEVWRRMAWTQAGQQNQVSFSVTGALLANGQATWTVEGNGTSATEHVDISGDHLSVVSNLLAPLIDRLPELVANLRN